MDEGVDGKTIFVTGSPMREVLEQYKDKILSSNILNEMSLKLKQYILVSAHREENIDNEDNFLSLMNSINNIATRYNMPVIYSTHPRSKKFIEKRGFKFNPLVKNVEPLGFFDYNKLQLNAYCVLSDSGTLSEESAMLSFPAVLIRTSTERPEVLDKGTIVIGGIKSEDIEQAIELAVAMHDNNEHTAMPDDYNDINTSIKVVKIIQSYAKIVDITTWRKN